MQVQPKVVHANGIVSVTMKAAFVGDATDATDQQRITAYGDPQVNLAGLFTDPNDVNFKFTFPASQLYVGISTQMLNFTARFMADIPVANPPSALNPYAPVDPFRCANYWGSTFPQQGASTQLGQLDCVVNDPVRAATIWAAAIDAEVQSVMATLRTKTPVQLTSLPNATV